MVTWSTVTSSRDTLLRHLVRSFGSALDSQSFLDDCLDTLVEAFSADRGLVVRLWPDGTLSAVNARGQGHALTPAERDEVSRTIVEEAREAEGAILWTPEGVPSESVRSFGILCALVAPLRARGNPDPIGVVYLDFRSLEKLPSSTDRDAMTAAAELLGPVLAQHDDLLRTRTALADDDREVAPTERPSLREILALPGMHEIRQDVLAFLPGDEPLLIEGESGSGKTLLATAIAEADDRRPIVRTMLGSSDDLNTIASELFGHRRGAFSGAVAHRVGVVEHADGGTLILDEVLNLSPRAQQLLLDFVQFGTYRPLGHDGVEPKHAKVRIIAVTNGDLASAVEEGRFRSDLFYRLASAPILMPPLRCRREDVPVLAERCLRRIAGPTWSLDRSLRELLVDPRWQWPGNVRQLHSLVRRAYQRASLRADSVLRRSDVREAELQGPRATAPTISAAPPSTTSPPSAPAVAPSSRRGAARPSPEELRTLLASYGGNVTRLAEALGRGRNTVYRWLRQAGIEPEAVRKSDD